MLIFAFNKLFIVITTKAPICFLQFIIVLNYHQVALDFLVLLAFILVVILLLQEVVMVWLQRQTNS